MKSLLRVFVTILLLSPFKTSASLIDVSFNGLIGYLNDPGNTLYTHEISVGDGFDANYKIDSNANSLLSFNSFYSPLTVYQIESDSVELKLDFGDTQETQPSSFDAYIVIGDNIIWDPDGATADPSDLLDVPDGDVWGIEVVYLEPSLLDFSMIFVDSTSTALNDDSFFINTSLSDWDYAYFNLGQFGQPCNVIAQGASPVPLPAGIYLFLSGLVGLVGVKLRGRNG